MQKVAVILCFCFLIKDVWPTTTGLATANKKLRLCVSKERKTDKIKINCLILGLEDLGVECVEGKDQLECLHHISNGSADFGVFNPEDLVAAQADDDATVIAEIRTSDRSFQRYVVAVVDNSVLADRPGRLFPVLKDRVLCHPGTDDGDLSAYSQTLNGYLEFLVQQSSECSSDESRVKTLADYFGRSCKAGPWVPDRIRDDQLKRQYSSLCAACGSGTCSAKDRYWGALGALACVVEVGEVAWAEMTHVKTFFSGSFFGLLSNREGPYQTPDKYALLCPDYSSQAITNATESCVWLHQPWPAIVARGNKLISVEKLTRTTMSPALQVILGTGSATLTPLEYPVSAVDYLARARGFQDAYSIKPCKEEIKKMFKCGDGVEIPQYKVCDGAKDCADGTDETFRTCRKNACPSYLFRCAYGGCVDAEAECNGIVECPDGSDEFEDLCDIPFPTQKPAPTGPTEKPIGRPTTTGSEKKLCVLPPYPEHGTYVVTDYPDAVPGQAFDSVHYTVTCSNGYNVIGDKKDRICFHGIWSNGISSCVRFCSLPKDPSVEYQCSASNDLSFESGSRICETQEPDGTVVVPACKAPNYYFPRVLRHMHCFDGRWTYIAKCIPECGYLSLPEDRLLFGGRKAEIGELPWHAVIYSKKTTPYLQICGGTLISTKAIVSAAHCFWNFSKNTSIPADHYAVGLGKLDRDYDSIRETAAHVHKSDVSEVHVSDRFRGKGSNFQGDIAVIILARPVVLDIFIRPVCIDFSLLFEQRQLQEGAVGKIATWGQTSRITSQNPYKILRVLKLPYISVQECIADSPAGFEALITSDKICAGYRNGSAICPGDSGSGLVFPEVDRGRTRYYLRGVASIAPVTEGFSCSVTWLTAFTMVSRHEQFLTKYISDV